MTKSKNRITNPQVHSRIIQSITLVLISTLFFLIMMEFAARIYLRYFTSEDEFFHYASIHQLEKRFKHNAVISQRYSPHRYLGFYPTPNFQKDGDRHNSLGYRGEEIVQPKPKNEFRIVCLGGSTTYTTGVHTFRESYPYLLEKELTKKGYKHVKVINAGAGNWASWESLINFQLRVLDLNPDMIIDYDAVNDIPARLVWPSTAYQGDNSGRKGPSISKFKPKFFEYSTLIRIFLIRAEWIRPHAELERALDQPADTYYGNLFLRQKEKNIYPEGIFKKVSALQMLRTNKPVYYRRNIEDLVTIAKQRGIQVILATFSYSPRVNNPQSSSAEYIFAYGEMEVIMKEIAQAAQVNLFDLANLFPTDQRYFTSDGIHVNQEGSELMARMFADYIETKHLIS